MIKLLLLLNAWQVFADIAKVLLWLILLMFLLGVLFLIVKWILSIVS